MFYCYYNIEQFVLCQPLFEHFFLNFNLSERLGHYSVALTLDLYSHVIPGLDQEAALKLDNHLP